MTILKLLCFYILVFTQWLNEILFTLTNSISISIFTMQLHMVLPKISLLSFPFYSSTPCAFPKTFVYKFSTWFFIQENSESKQWAFERNKAQPIKKLASLGCCRKIFLHSQVGFSCERTPKKFFLRSVDDCEWKKNKLR